MKRKPAPATLTQAHSQLALLFGFMAAIAITAILTTSAWAGPTATATTPSPTKTVATTQVVDPRLVRPGDMQSGGLLFQAVENSRYVIAPMQATDVSVEITGLTARTKVTQKFFNPSDGWVEGLYVFPLPDEAAVDSLRLQIGDRFIEGKIKERAEARKIYEQAKAEGKKASLLEQERANIFTNSVANIGPGEVVVVQIEYQEALSMTDGRVDLRFPMVVAPRYNPPATLQTVSFGDQGFGQVNVADPVPDRDRITSPVLDPREMGEGQFVNPVTMSVTLRPGFPVDKVESLYHQTTRSEIAGGGYQIALTDEVIPANKDFVLSWTPKSGNAPTAALFKQRIGGEDYIFAMITPPLQQSDTAVKPRETIFVIDNSGSMAGTSIRQAKASLVMALGRLTDQDLFNVIRFDHETELVFPSPVAATQENIEHATKFVKRLNAEGGTEMLPALRHALVDRTPDDTSRLRQVIFLTDGAIGNEAQLFAEIGNNLGRSRLFTVGIGSAPNSYFMSRASRIGRGSATHIGDLSEVSARMSELFQKLERPAMTDLTVIWPGAARAESWPNPLPDLYAGDPIILTAKMPQATGQLIIKGTHDGQGWATALNLDDAAQGAGIDKVWARRKIAAIEESRYDGVDWETVDKQVLTTALDYHLVSRLTSLVAVDVTPSRPDGENLTSLEVPLNLPEGWDFDKVFGEPVRSMRAQADPQVDQTFAFAQLSKASAPPQAAPKTAGLALPQGAALTSLHFLAGLILIISGTSLLVIRRRPHPWKGKQ